MIREEIIRTIPLEAGGVLENAHIVFHTSGKKAGKVIWIYHAMTSTSNPEDWWPGIVGPGKIIARSAFDAYCYYAQSCALDSHNVGRGRGGVKKALEQIVADTVVVNVDTDLLFPPEEGREWSSYIPKAYYTVIKSDFGHDGILLEIEQLKHIVNSVL